MNPPKTFRIYISSKTKHIPRWKALQKKLEEDFTRRGIILIGKWLDAPATAAGVEDPRSLAIDTIAEPASCHALLLYLENNEQPKGALAEVGAALSHNVQVRYVGPTNNPTISPILRHHPLWLEFPTVEDALAGTNEKRISQ